MKNGPYTLVISPEDYPGKKYRGRYVYEHHLVWWKSTGQLVPEGWLLHHKNHVKTDNVLENLELKERGAHTSEHWLGTAEKVPTTCDWCGVVFSAQGRHIRSAKKSGQTRFFCCRSHATRNQQRVIREAKAG